MADDKVVRVGFQPAAGTPLDRLGRELLTAALAYREELSKHEALSAVVWATYASGELVVVTRGEYRDLLMENVEEIGREPRPVHR